MHLNTTACYRALSSRDVRFDGKFFVGVRTTGVYCRPICPAPTALRKNCVFYECATQAEASGFRPCLRCFPERSPHYVDRQLHDSLLTRALKLIESGLLDEGGVESVSERLGISSRHLRRLFMNGLGVTPIAFARTRRVQLAKRLIDETQLSITQIAFASGFRSIRQFNGTFREIYQRSPREIRRDEKGQGVATGSFQLRLSFRPPLNWGSMLKFIEPRLLTGIEKIRDGVYSRRVTYGDESDVIEITEGDGDFLLLSVPTSLWEHVHKLVASARRLFDLDSDPLVIGRQLAADKLLAKLVRKDVAVRLPGCWDPFEMSVRAILGQQISVAGATTICGRLIEKWGEKNREGKHPAWTFPDPARLARVDVAKIGMPATRAQTVRTFSRAVARGEVRLDGSVGLEQLILELTALPGIGDWTANYIAMRACGEPDAFPAGDLGVRKALSSGDRLISEREVLQIAEQWKPWRAYAAILLWKNL